MQTDEISELVLSFISERVDARVASIGIKGSQTVKPETTLLATGLFDSIGFLTLLGDIESHFGVELDLTEHDPSMFTRVGGLARIVSAALGSNRAESASTPASQDRFTIVALSPRDPHWGKLGHLFEGMYESFDQDHLTLKLGRNGASKWLEAVANAAGGMQRVFGCVVQAELVGFLHASIRVVPPHLSMKLVGSVEALYVDQSQRGKGVAEALVRHATEWFSARNVEQVELQVLTTNDGALSFWKKQGFHPELVQMTKPLVAE